MSKFRYRVGDEYPNLKGKVVWAGSVKTDTITGVLVANGLSSGAFTGAILVDSSISENDTQSSINWTFDVDNTDTAAVGDFDICIQLVHDNNDQETIDPGCRVEVLACA